MKIKPGSLGKAAPPYDVQVWWSPFLFTVIIESEKWESTTYSTTFSTIWWYSGLWVVELLCWLVLERGALKMWKHNYPFAFSVADYRWKRQCSASRGRRRHCYQNWCQAAIHFFHSIRGKPTVNFLRASSGLQHDMHLYLQEEVQHKRLVALLNLTVLWLQWLFDSVAWDKVSMAGTCNSSNFSIRWSPMPFPNIFHLDYCNNINPKQAAKLKRSPSHLVEGVLTPSAFQGNDSAASMLLFLCRNTGLLLLPPSLIHNYRQHRRQEEILKVYTQIMHRYWVYVYVPPTVILLIQKGIQQWCCCIYVFFLQTWSLRQAAGISTSREK